MEIKSNRRTHVFYHADRYAKLKEGQEIELNENNLSVFGESYWPIFQSKSVEEMDQTQQREYYLEIIRQEPAFSLYSSRLQCMFAANTLAEAIVFAKTISPLPDHPIPIFEIYADQFWTLDSNWMDYEVVPNQQIDNYRMYWAGRITNSNPPAGERRPPRLEVLIALPAKAGKIVHTVNCGDADLL